MYVSEFYYPINFCPGLHSSNVYSGLLQTRRGQICQGILVFLKLELASTILKLIAINLEVGCHYLEGPMTVPRNCNWYFSLGHWNAPT